MPSIVEKKKTRGVSRPTVTVEATYDQIVGAKRLALQLTNEMIHQAADSMRNSVRSASKVDRRNVEQLTKQLTGLFTQALTGVELPDASALFDLVIELDDALPGDHDIRTARFERLLLWTLEDFTQGHKGGYTAEMLVVVLADMFRLYGRIDSSNTLLWFVASVRPDQLWIKPARGVPKHVVKSADTHGFVWSPAAVHWVNSCHATAQSL